MGPLRRVTSVHGLTALLFTFALAVRLFALTDESLWLDEIATVDFVRETALLDVIPRTFHIDFHPFAYYLLLDLWTSLAGTTDTAVRLLSALLGASSVALIFHVARVASGSSLAGVLAAIVSAVAPTAVWYAQESRMYVFMLAGYAAALLLLLRIVRSGWTPWRAVAFVSSALAFAYAHAVSGLLTLPLWCGVLLLPRLGGGEAAKGSSARARLVAGGLALAYLPWIVRLTSIQATDKRLGVLDPTELLETTRRLLVPRPLGSWVEAALILLVVGMTLVGLARGLRERRLALRPVALLVCAFVVPLLTMTVLSVFREAHQARNLVFLHVPLVVLVGVGLAEHNLGTAGSARRSAVRGVALLTYVGLVGFLASGTRHDLLLHGQKEDWRGAARLVDAALVDGDLLAFHDGFTEPCFDRYATGRARRDVTTIGVSRDGDRFDADLARLVRGVEALAPDRTAWLFYSHGTRRDEVDLALVSSGRSGTPVHRSYGLELIAYRRK